MTDKMLSAPAVLRAAVRCGAVPAEAEVSRRGSVRWQSDGLAYLGWISKNTSGMVDWHLNAGDAKFSSALERYGGLSVPIRGSDDLPWPARVDDRLEKYLREGLGRATRFVNDRADLCALLTSPEDVRRGTLHAWLPLGSYPARLVLALVLARDMGAADLEAQIRGSMDQEPISMSRGGPIDVLASAKRWASKFSKELGFDIPV